VRIVPRSPKGKIVHKDAVELLGRCMVRSLCAPEVLLGALKEMCLRPGRALHALGVILGRGNWITRLKNLVVYPKGLWLAALARDFHADHIHAHWLSTPATIAMIASEVAGIPWSCTAHRADIDLNNLLPAKLSYAQFVRFISESGMRMAASLGAKPKAESAAVIHLGVDLPPQPMAGTSAKDEVTILCPANLLPVKGHKYLIDAMGIPQVRARKCRLLIAGKGKLRVELEQQVQSLGLGDRIEFLGQRSHTDLLDMYRKGEVDAVVLPSVDLGDNLHEGIPVSLMEAMSYAIPVISTQTGGIPELLGGGAGLLVPDKNPQALADAIQRLAEDPVLRAEIGRRGRQRIVESFSVEAVVSQLLARISPNAGCPNREGETIRV
jgi:colanic acid/amylovoran biosynthesis glycosyltransferase